MLHWHKGAFHRKESGSPSSEHVFVFSRVDTQPARGAVLLVLLCVHERHMDSHPLYHHPQGSRKHQQGCRLQRQVQRPRTEVAHVC